MSMTCFPTVSPLAMFHHRGGAHGSGLVAPMLSPAATATNVVNRRASLH